MTLAAGVVHPTQPVTVPLTRAIELFDEVMYQVRGLNKENALRFCSCFCYTFSVARVLTCFDNCFNDVARCN